MKPDEQYTKEFTASFIEFARGKVNNPEDLGRIIDLAFLNDNKPAFEEMAFHAKYLIGLMHIIQIKDSPMDDEYFKKVKAEYAEHIEKVKEKFAVIIEPGSDFVKEIFKKKYFELTHESLEHLNKLCEDLGRVKSYINDLKERGKGF
jgi:hypothetical protein